MARLEASNSEFGAQTRKMVSKMSPLSLAVIFEQIKRGSTMKIRDVFQMEFGMSQGYMNHTEFSEGIRAHLVDKDM
jgi:enoyl-CoA hydratase/carnithine racemase